ncbi:MAG: ComEC/Rec2 family competence protein, partial [Elusimicrobia bacterium]|nr:ComEC/Rec2 family competence protein [Elusimicrobiota bacterium]
MGILRRPLFWAVVAGALAVLTARRAGLLAPGRDDNWKEAAYAGPVRVAGALDAPVRQTRRGWRTRLVFGSPSGPQRAQVWLPRGRGIGDLEKGRRAVVAGKLRLPRRPRDPGDFNEKAALEAAGCGWVLHASEVTVSTAAAPARFLPWAWAQRARLSAEGAFSRRLPPQRAALLSGIALGDAGALSDGLAKAVRDAGATHLLVASGSNVGFAAAMAALLGLAAGLRPGGRAALILAAAGFYTLMAGADPPCVRAWVTLAAALAGRALGRETTASAALTLAAAALLVLDPASALSPSAVMSVG